HRGDGVLAHGGAVDLDALDEHDPVTHGAAVGGKGRTDHGHRVGSPLGQGPVDHGADRPTQGRIDLLVEQADATRTQVTDDFHVAVTGLLGGQGTGVGGHRHDLGGRVGGGELEFGVPPGADELDGGVTGAGEVVGDHGDVGALHERPSLSVWEARARSSSSFSSWAGWAPARRSTHVVTTGASTAVIRTLAATWEVAVPT